MSGGGKGAAAYACRHKLGMFSGTVCPPWGGLGAVRVTCSHPTSRAECVPGLIPARTGLGAPRAPAWTSGTNAQRSGRRWKRTGAHKTMCGPGIHQRQPSLGHVRHVSRRAARRGGAGNGRTSYVHRAGKVGTNLSQISCRSNSGLENTVFQSSLIGFDVPIIQCEPTHRLARPSPALLPNPLPDNDPGARE